MSLVESFIDSVRGRGLRVVLPEGHDARIVAAARRLRDENIAVPIVIGERVKVEQAARDAGIGLTDIQTIDIGESKHVEAYAADYAATRGMKPRVAVRMVSRPLVFGGMMVKRGEAETLVAGVGTATANVIQAAALTIGYAPGIETASSFFLMVLPEFQGRRDRPLIFADCAVNIAPTPTQLADIALASEASAGRLLDEVPRVALLSFSTQGSAAHEHVERVKQALEIIRERSPQARIDGEFQADTALMSAVAAKKIKTPSDVAGQANVLIFPDLNAGNIAYKLVQYLAGARAIGPFLQGFAHPVSDLSRGASVDDVVATTAVCLAQAQGEKIA